MIAAHMVTRRNFIGGISALLGAVGCGTEQSSGQRPMNVLFLFPDQMRAQAMGCMGNPDVKTPNLDRLAAEGLLFRNHFA